MRVKFTLILLFPALLGWAQLSELASKDMSDGKSIIPVSEISLRSGEDLLWSYQLYETLMSDEEISRLEAENDSLINIVDSILIADKAQESQSLNFRYLENKSAYWKQWYDILDGQKILFSNVIEQIDAAYIKLEDKSRIWKNTKSIHEGQENEINIVNRIDQLLFKMDSIGSLVQNKRGNVLLILDRAANQSTSIREYSEEIEERMMNREGELFVRTNQSIFSLGFADWQNWQIKAPLRNFYHIEFKPSVDYLRNKILNLVLQIILLILLTLIFRGVYKSLSKKRLEKGSYYQRMLVLLLSHGLNAALVLGFFASILIFTNRPALFNDIVKRIALVPLILIVASLVQTRLRYLVYLFGFTVYLQMVIFIFPPDNLIYRGVMIFICLVELFLLWKVHLYIKQNPLKNIITNALIQGLALLNIGMAFLGIIGAVSGAIMLGEFMLNIPLISIFASMLLIISVLILGGLIELLVDSEFGRKMIVIRQYGDSIKNSAIRLIKLGAFIYWIFIFLRVSHIQNSMMDWITALFTAELKLGTATLTLGKITSFFLVIWISIVISRIIRAILEKDVLNNLKLAKGLPHTIALLVRYGIVTAGVLLAVSAAGIPLTNLTVILGAFGVGIGFGLQNIFNNLVSGFILLFERPIQIGDTVEVGELMGKVKSIGIRSSNVRTFDGAEVIVPNGQLVSNEVINWTLTDQQKRLEIIAGVAYGSDPHKVKELFMAVLEKHPDVIQDPQPMVLFIGLGDSSLDFRLLFWTANIGEWLRIRSEVLFEVHDTLYAEGIQIPFPQRDLHIRSIDAEIKMPAKEDKKGK